MIVSLFRSPAVRVHLLEYLQEHLGVKGLYYRHEPWQITDGWETYIYRFQLHHQDGLAAPFLSPLILRIYSSPYGLPRLRQEFAAQCHMRGLGYPVAQPLLLEERSDIFGGPFMIMEHVPGRTLFDLLLHQPWRIAGCPGKMARAHVQLHTFPCSGFPAPPGDFLGRRLKEMDAIVEEYGLSGLRTGLAWLNDRRPEPPESPSIIHLDFHPFNLMVQRGVCTGVLDWNESDVGDRHADIATALVLMRSAPVEVSRLVHRLSIRPGRFWLRHLYLSAYRRSLPVDDRLLAYYIAWAALRRLCAYGRWLRAGPGITGCKASSLRYLSPERVGILRACFREWAGMTVHL